MVLFCVLSSLVSCYTCIHFKYIFLNFLRSYLDSFFLLFVHTFFPMFSYFSLIVLCLVPCYSSFILFVLFKKWCSMLLFLEVFCVVFCYLSCILLGLVKYYLSCVLFSYIPFALFLATFFYILLFNLSLHFSKLSYLVRCCFSGILF